MAAIEGMNAGQLRGLVYELALTRQQGGWQKDNYTANLAKWGVEFKHIAAEVLASREKEDAEKRERQGAKGALKKVVGKGAPAAA